GIRIRPDRLRLDAHAREHLRALRQQQRDVARHRPERDLHWLVRVARALDIDRARDIARGAGNERAQTPREILLLRARDINRDDRDGETREIACEDLPVAVDDGPPLGFDGQTEHAVLFGEIAVVTAAHDLQVPKAHREPGEDEYDNDEHRDEAIRPDEVARRLSHSPKDACFSVTWRMDLAIG